jgi:hypothetical protein
MAERHAQALEKYERKLSGCKKAIRAQTEKMSKFMEHESSFNASKEAQREVLMERYESINTYRETLHEYDQAEIKALRRLVEIGEVRIAQLSTAWDKMADVAVAYQQELADLGKQVGMLSEDGYSDESDE